MACRADQLNYEIALNLSAYLHNERNYVPWRAFFNSIDFIKGMLSTSNAYGMLKVRSLFQFVCVHVCERVGVRVCVCMCAHVCARATMRAFCRCFAGRENVAPYK